MKRRLGCGALIGLVLVAGARAQNPEDIEFRAELVKKSAAFHMGEPIEVEISYASSAEKKYLHTSIGLGPYFGNVEVEVAPREGVTDLRELARGYAGSAVGSQDYLDRKPRVQNLEVNQWFRFAKAGHFLLTLKSKAVQRRRTEEEGGGFERLTLEAEPLAFDILPEDPAWETAELNEIEGILEQGPAEAGERSRAMHRLSLLDSPAAVKKLVEIYLGGPRVDWTGDAHRGLNDSRQLELIIALLKEAMSDPAENPHAIGADMLAELEMRKDKGILPPRPADPDGQKEWQEKLAERNKTYNDFYGQANALLVASLKGRTGKERAEATYEAWNNAERQNAGKPATAGVEALRKEVLETASELPIGYQLNFASSNWNTLPHAQLRTILERLIANDGEQALFMRNEGYKFLCQDWPRDCAASILAEAQQPGSKLDRNAILLLPEAEHPELDEMLAEELRGVGLLDTKVPVDSSASQRVSALIMRAGSRKLVKVVQEFLDQPNPSHTYGCQTRAALIGYLLRFAPEDAVKRTLAVTLDEGNDCGRGILQVIGEERYSEELLLVAHQTLESENLGAAASAALVLGRHGTAADEERLRGRLQGFWKTWGTRAAELRSARSAGMRLPGSTNALYAAGLEVSLISALVDGKNWKLTDVEKEDLRAGCLTDDCRAIADGKMRMSF